MSEVSNEATPETRDRPDFLRGYAPGQVGASVELPEGAEVTVLQSANGDNRNPELVTVQVGVFPLSAVPWEGWPSSTRVEILLTWGVGSTFANAIFTPRRGSTITLSATSIKVAARRLALPGEAGQPPCQVTAFFAYGSRPAAGDIAGPVYDTVTQRVAPAGSITFPLVAWSSTAAILTTVPGGLASLTVEQLSAGGAVLATHSGAETIPLIAGASRIRITNGGGVFQDIIVSQGLSL